MKQKENRIWNGIERVGNKLPHPVYIFIILTVVVFILSALCGNIVFPHPNTGEEQYISNLMSKDGLTWLLQSMVENFITFSPLGMTLVAMLGIGIAEETGLVTAVIKRSIAGAPKVLVTAIVIFVGIMGSLAGSATFVIIPPLGAMVFKGMGRHPIAGLASGFAGVSAGLSANLLLTQTDVLLSGITETAAQIYDPNYLVNPSVNWYFMAASTIVLTIVGTFVVDKIVEPRLGAYNPEDADGVTDTSEAQLKVVTDDEKAGMRWALIAVVVYVAIVLAGVLPQNGILRGEDGAVLQSPFMSGMIPLMTLFFLVAGLAYGIRTRTIKKGADVINYWTKSMSGLAGFVVLCFFAGQFVKAFSKSNLGLYLSVKGSEFLAETNLTGIPLIVVFILITMLINFMIGSASAKWALMAPIFVPMFMKIGFTPAFTQAAFRIADSVTNAISPLEPFMPFIIITAMKYDRKSGLGSIIATMLPLALAFAVSWILLIILWYVLDLPLGPGSAIFM